MTKAQSAPRRIALRKSTRPVILTIGVPQPVGSDWGCAVQIAGLDRRLSRPRFVFGVDAFQALHLAMQFASVTLETSGHELEWLGETGDLGLPKFLPNYLPKAHQVRLERLVDRELARFYAAAQRRGDRKIGRRSGRRTSD